MLTWIILPILGIVVGILSGMLGIGGGIILVPMLAMILPLITPNADIVVHLALGSSLACASLTLFSSSLAHKRNGNLDKRICYNSLPGIITGAIVGPYIVHLLPSEILRYIIGFILFAFAINMAFDYEIPASRKLPNTTVLLLSGLILALISSFAGLSGAALIIPYLLWFGLPIRRAVGTASMMGLPLSIVGMCSYMIVGYHTDNLPSGAIGYVYWPAVICIALTSVPAAQISAKFSANVPKEQLKRLLAILLTLVAAKMLFF